jgi:hypothetical protein
LETCLTSCPKQRLGVCARVPKVTPDEHKIAGWLTVTGNTGTVIDKPNEVKGKSKLR